MNSDEHILTVLAEEGCEVAKEVSKALRFGLDDKLTVDPDGPRGTEGPTNREKIAMEFVQMIAVYQMCVNRGLLPSLGITVIDPIVAAQAAAKQQKVYAYMGYGRRVGAITD